MVEFYDPITKKNISYHIDKKLQARWDTLREGKLIKRDDDRVYLVDGRERIGKSLFTFQQAKYLDPTFDVDRICFTPDEFLNQIRKAPQGSCVVFDEAFRGLSSKASQSKVNKKIVQGLMECGQRNLIIFIVLPTFFLLELYPAVLRSNTLFHLFKDKRERRFFRVYNYQKKSLLYNIGKKKGFSYGFPRTKFKGQYFNIKPIDWSAYTKKKLSSLMENDQGAIEEKETHTTKERNIFFMSLLKKNEGNLSKTIRELKETYGIEKSIKQLGRIRDKFNGENTAKVD